MLTAKINPVQLIDISKAVIDKIIIFLYELNIKKKLLILVKNNKIKKRNIKDQSPLWNATSIDGTCFISLKISGCGIPQNKEAKQIKKVPFKKEFIFKIN